MRKEYIKYFCFNSGLTKQNHERKQSSEYDCCQKGFSTSRFHVCLHEIPSQMESAPKHCWVLLRALLQIDDFGIGLI